MTIKESLDRVFVPHVPRPLSTHIIQQSTCELKDEEKKGGNEAFHLFNLYIQNYPIQKGSAAYVIYFDYQLNLIPEDNLLGQFVPLVALPLHLIRQKEEYSADFVMLILLEELCHCFYQIRNEYLVKTKALSVLHIDDKYKPNSLHDVWPTVFDANNRPISSVYPNDYGELTSSLSFLNKVQIL